MRNGFEAVGNKAASLYTRSFLRFVSFASGRRYVVKTGFGQKNKREGRQQALPHPEKCRSRRMARMPRAMSVKQHGRSAPPANAFAADEKERLIRQGGGLIKKTAVNPDINPGFCRATLFSNRIKTTTCFMNAYDTIRKNLVYGAGLLLLWIGNASSAQESWWPVQKSPRYIIRCTLSDPTDVREMNLAQSVSGLAAQALNAGTGDEGVWIETRLPDYRIYYKALLTRIRAAETGETDVWSLVRRYSEKGIVKGYVLYDSRRNDNSVNAATVQAGIRQGILVDVSQEKQAQSLGLARLYDACAVRLDRQWFEQAKTKLDNRLIVLANPAAGNNRDYAIAHKAMLYYGVDSLLDAILEWAAPLSPVVGWNSGPEFEHIAPCSEWGLINTASDWCMNLPLLSVPGQAAPVRFESLDLQTIDWDDTAPCHAFVMSDGDNMQWTFGGFIHSADYWANRYNSRLPMSFTSCAVNLSMAAPDVLHVLAASQSPHTSVVEYGGGYYYPDLFASKRAGRDRLLRRFARIVNAHLQRTGIRVFGFICRDVNSEAARHAYRIFAEELEDIAGMIAVQYVPYNGGKGKVFWAPGKNGQRIPVLTAKTQIWASLDGPGSGNPQRVAAYINDEAKKGAGESRFGWTIVHAWSRFGRDAGGNVTDVAPKGNAGVRGVTPVWWCRERLDANIRVVAVEELLWRLRMEHDKQATVRVLESLSQRDNK